jgi:hypothetical protein
MSQDQDSKERSRTETFETVGSNLLDMLRKLLYHGNIRRLIIRKADGHTMIDVTLTAGFAMSAAAILLAPPLAAVAIIAGVMTKVEVEVVRMENDD